MIYEAYHRRKLASIQAPPISGKAERVVVAPKDRSINYCRISRNALETIQLREIVLAVVVIESAGKR